MIVLFERIWKVPRTRKELNRNYFSYYLAVKHIELFQKLIQNKGSQNKVIFFSHTFVNISIHFRDPKCFEIGSPIWNMLYLYAYVQPEQRHLREYLSLAEVDPDHIQTRLRTGRDQSRHCALLPDLLMKNKKTRLHLNPDRELQITNWLQTYYKLITNSLQTY